MLRWLWGAIALGTVIRLALALGDTHRSFDIDSYYEVGRALQDSPLEVYALVESVRWPYPSSYLPWVWTSITLTDHTPLPFSGLIKLPVIAADAVLAWLVYSEVARSTRREGFAVAAGCLVALGPTFVINAGYHGQIDSLAILPAVAAVVVWGRVPPGRRGLLVGVLIGVGASFKSPAGLVLLALLPLCTTRREAAALVAGTAGVLLLVLAPFLVSTPSNVVEALTFGDVVGVGGLTFILLNDVEAIGAARFLHEHSVVVVGLAMLLPLLLLWRRRPVPAAVAASLLWLCFYAIAPGFFFGYLVWGIPFFLLAGYVRATAALMALVLVPTLLFELGEIEGNYRIFQVLTSAVWVAFVVCFVWQLREVWRRPRLAAENAQSRG